MTRPRDPVWLPTATVYTTHDAAGRPHVCPAAARLASDPEFAARVRVRTEARRGGKLGGDVVSAEKCEKVTGYR